jgi:hypothetical protein
MFTLYAIASIGLGMLSYSGYSQEQCQAEAERLNRAKTGFHYYCADDSSARRVR